MSTSDEAKDTARLEAFSDGIFGVAITLLAIEIGIKELEPATGANLRAHLVELWPELLTYANSFAVVLLVWLGHHRIVRQLRTADTPVMMLNGLVLMLVALFPFPTRTAGRFVGTEAETVAVVLYVGYTGLVTLSMLALTSYLRRRDGLLLRPATGLPVLARLRRQEVVAVAIYGALAAVAAAGAPRWALAGTVAMWVYWAASVAASDEPRPTARPGGEAAAPADGPPR